MASPKRITTLQIVNATNSPLTTGQCNAYQMNKWEFKTIGHHGDRRFRVEFKKQKHDQDDHAEQRFVIGGADNFELQAKSEGGSHHRLQVKILASLPTYVIVTAEESLFGLYAGQPMPENWDWLPLLAGSTQIIGYMNDAEMALGLVDLALLMVDPKQCSEYQKLIKDENLSTKQKYDLSERLTALYPVGK